MKKANNNFRVFCILLGLLTFTWHASAQKLSLLGMVMSENGEPLSGSTVQIKGSSIGAITDLKGEFILEVNQYPATVLISFQGYTSKEITVSEAPEYLKIKLKEDLKQLNDLVITATRSARDIENVPQKVQVISRKDIENTIATDITDVMKKSAAVDVIQYPGLLSGIGIRGFRPEFSGINQRTLLLIDGRPAGATNLATIDMNNVERIEVLNGPASALYGAQAMGGVVNLITKKTDGDITGRVYGALGNFGRAEGGFSTGGNINKKLDFDLSFNSYTQAKDFRMGAGNLFRNLFDSDQATRIIWTDNGKREIDIDDVRGDGEIRPNTTYKNYSGAFRLGYDINNQWRVDAKVDRFYAEDVNSPGNIENGNLSPNLKDLERAGGDVIINGSITEKNEITVKLFAAREQTTRYRLQVNDSTTVRTSFKNGQDQLDWIGAQVMDRQQIGTHFLTTGIDINQIKQNDLRFNDRGVVNPVSAQSPNFTQRNTGIYFQGELNFLNNRLNATAGIRNEIIAYNITGTDQFPSRSETNNIINPSLGINFNFANNLFLHSTFGTAFTPVGAFEIAGYDERRVDQNSNDGSDTVDVWSGNPDLENQQSQTFDIGIRYYGEENPLSFDITIFYTSLQNNIVNNVIQFPGRLSETGAVIRNYNTYANSEQTILNGLEFDLSYYLPSGFGLFANGVFILKAEEIREIFRQPEPLTLNMHNVANLNLNYGVSYDMSWLSVHLTGRYVGERLDTDWSYYLSSDNVANDYADIQYPAFMTIDLTTSVTIGNSKFTVLLGNITDENYYEKRGFNLMGRNYMLRYSLNF
ncbi:MAG: TonB-dependent receptor [Cyclobacteriaceae bacterium]